MSFLTDTTHLHITTWVIGVVLFVIAAMGAKPNKGLHMALRLFYILIIISGAALFFKHQGIDNMMYGIKFLMGILTIGMMEMTLVKKAKGQAYNLFMILFAVFLFITLFLGFKLPVGFNFLA